MQSGLRAVSRGPLRGTVRTMHTRCIDDHYKLSHEERSIVATDEGVPVEIGPVAHGRRCGVGASRTTPRM